MTVVTRIENHFAAPPEYVQAWLNDFREDDMRLMGAGNERKMPVRITRASGKVVRDFPTPMGPCHTETSFAPGRWEGTATITDKKGRVRVVSRLTETVRPDGNGGTVHNVVLEDDPHGAAMKLVYPIFARVNLRMLKSRLFATAKREIEANYRAGKPPTA